MTGNRLLCTNDYFLVIVLAVPALVVLQVFFVYAKYSYWAVPAVSAAVLQLCYFQVLETAASLVQYQTMVFYDSTTYVVNGTAASSQIAAHYDLLTQDLRLSLDGNQRYFAGAWVVLLVFGLGVPTWFIGAYLYIERRETTEDAQSKLRFLVRDYRVEYWFWETVVVVRKALAVIFVGSLAVFPVLQLLAILTLYFAYILAHEKCLPYSVEHRADADRASYLAAAFVVLSMFAAYIAETKNSAGSAVFVAFVITSQVLAVLVILRAVAVDISVARSTAAVTAVAAGSDVSAAVETEIEEYENLPSEALRPTHGLTELQ